MKFDHKFSFNDHIPELCKKANRKIHALSRGASYINIAKNKYSYECVLQSQFSYWSLVWMCNSCVKSGKINSLRESGLQIIYSEKQSLFERLSEKDGTVSIHNTNLQIFAVEMYKIRNSLSPLTETELFEQKNGKHWDLISFLGPKISNILLGRLENANSIEAFKIQRKMQKMQKTSVAVGKL